MPSETPDAIPKAQLHLKPLGSNEEQLPPPILSLNGCVVRPYHPLDAESSAAQANNPNLARYLSDGFPQPYTLDVAREWIQRCLNEDPARNFAIVEPATNAFLGAIGMQPQSQEHTVEIGYWLGETYWKKGIMSLVVGTFTDWVFTTRPQIMRVEATVFEGNKGSEIVLQRKGFIEDEALKKMVPKGGQLIELHTHFLSRDEWERRKDTQLKNC